MRIFTKLGLAFLVVFMTSGMLWSQTSFNDASPKISNNPIATDAMFDLQFDYPVGVGDGEAGIETDGSYIYTSKWNGTGQFRKYDMDGNYLSEFSIAGSTGCRDIAYDGTYFYGGAAATTVFQMDFDAGTMVSTFTAPANVRAIAYNEDDDAFYANNWSDNITKFDMTGANLGSFACGPTGASYYGFAYQGASYCGDGPFLWGYAQTGATSNELVQIELPSGTETGVYFDVGSVAAVGTGIAGGLCIDNNLWPDSWTIMGTAQNVDIWGLELCASSPSGPIFSDDFDSYTAGQQLACQNPDGWTTWSIDPCNATEDPYVSDAYANSGANSVVIVQNNDLVKDLGDPYTSGAYVISFNAYIPTGATGYFNTLQEFTGTQTWGLEVYFNAGGAGSVNAGGTGTATFTWPADTWFQVQNIVDLDMDYAELWINGSMIYSYQWSLGATGTGVNSLEANDFFGAAATDEMYMDDYTFDVYAPPTYVFMDDFEAYTAGQQVACQNPDDWTTWSLDPCNATEDAYISDNYAHSGSNSAVIVQNNDLVKDYGDPYTSGKYSISFYAYIPTGATGYFNTLQEFTATQTWGLEVYFNAGGAGSINANGTGTATFTWPADTWFFVEHIVDLDNDNSEIWIDGSMIYSYQWSLGANGTGVNSLEANDFFGAAATDEMYFDDYTIEDISGGGTTLDPPMNVTASVVDDVNVMVDWDAPGGGQVGSVLVVDRDGSGGTLGFTDDWQYIQPALDNMGVSYTYYEVVDLTQNGPDLATMQAADVIIWLTGESWQNSQTMTDTDESNLATYLDGGGRLFLSGMDYLYDKFPSAGSFTAGQFPYDYLGVSSVSQDFWSVFSPDLASISGVAGSFADGMTFQAADIYTTDKDGLYIDQITSMGQDLFQVTTPTPAGMAAVQYNGGDFRTVFTTLPIPAVTDPAMIENILTAGLSWLSNSDGDALQGYNVYRDGSMLDFTTETSYLDENLDPGTYEYCVSAVYDEGESDQVCAPDVEIVEPQCYWSDNFDSYTAGQQLACQNPDEWTTWSLDPCNATEDPYVSDNYAHSGSNSTVIVQNNDLVKDFGNPFTSGLFTISFYAYIPTGGTGYFNTLQEFTSAQTWGLEVYFNASGAGSINANGTGTATFTWPEDTWFEVKHVVDLDNDNSEIWIDDSMIYSYQWSLGATGTGVNSLEANDFFGAAATDEMYIDDYCLEGNPPNLPPPLNLTGPASVLTGENIHLEWDEPAGAGQYIQWDAGVNNGNGIGLTGGGTFSVASHWSPADLAPYDGFVLSKIQFFPNDDPAATFVVKVWTGAAGTNMVSSENVTSFNVGEWNEVDLSTPVTIDASQDLWFGYTVTHGDGTFPAGCDDGPAVVGKGDMISTGGAWDDLVNLVSTLDYNWNLAGYVGLFDGGKMVYQPMTMEDPLVSTSTSFAANGPTGISTKMPINGTKDLLGYNVYRDGANVGYVTITEFDEVLTVADQYEYYVTAVYDSGESEPSNTILVDVIDGVDEMVAHQTQVYPNPASDVVNIKSGFTINSVKVLNYSGQVISNEAVNDNEYRINTSKYNSGIYFFQIYTEEGMISKRIIVQ